MAKRTATTGNALLGLLALRPSWAIYELTQQLRRNMRWFWPRVESRIYDEAKNLVRQGLATAETRNLGGRRRTVYAITDRGREQLRTWLSTPPNETALESEPLLRVMLMDLGPPDAALQAIDEVEATARTMLEIARTVGREYLDGTAPFQDQVPSRAIVFDFLTSHALMLDGWCSRARAALAAYGKGPRQRDRAALSIIRSALDRFEPEPAKPRAQLRRDADLRQPPPVPAAAYVRAHRTRTR
jgi:PadR family transcriptional regulator, regulatory protein AphA